MYDILVMGGLSSFAIIAAIVLKRNGNGTALNKSYLTTIQVHKEYISVLEDRKQVKEKV